MPARKSKLKGKTKKPHGDKEEMAAMRGVVKRRKKKKKDRQKKLQKASGQNI